MNGKKLSPVALLDELNALGRGERRRPHRPGRKSLRRHEVARRYETPGGTLLVTAHRELEALCVDRETAHYEQMLSLRYAELVYYGLWFTPLRGALDAFFSTMQQRVTGRSACGSTRATSP